MKPNQWPWPNYWMLVRAFAWSDFKLRFHGSVLGIFWSFLRPLLLFGVLYLVFSKFVRFDIPNYSLYLLLGIILWNFFVEATNFALVSIDSKTALLKKVPFPRTIIVLSATITSFISLLLNLTVFFLFFLFSELTLGPAALFLGFYLVALFIIGLGASYLLTALYSKFKDVKTIWEVLLQLGFWLTPIIYTLSIVPQKLHFWLYLNPLTRIIQYSREAIMENRVSNLDGILALGLAAGVIFVFGYLIFRARAKYFAEEL